MASTPPAQIRTEIRTPPTPLHGSAYYSNSPSRYNTRSATKRTSDSAHSSFTQSPKSARTPQSPQQSDLHFHSPQATPKRKSTRHPQVISPTSPNSDSIESSMSTHTKPTYLSASTILSEGMLPTPAKTPQKKQIPKSSMAARALFQDQSTTVFESPRKSQNKKVRHNGFSLESFSENAASQDAIQIHVDSRDQLPEVDTSAENPFYVAPASESKKRTASSSQKVPGTSKRRKTSSTKKSVDPQVEDAIDKDEGMVYVFRGKKVYRRFDDAGDEEEVIDPEELGLLAHRHDGAEIVKPLKTLTRKTIKPKRLFQQEREPLQSDEEAETEIEDNHPKGEKETDPREEQSSPSRSTRSRATKEVSNSTTGTKRKRGSPFDTWRRLKSGSSASDTVPATKARKRTAAEALEA